MKPKKTIKQVKPKPKKQELFLDMSIMREVYQSKKALFDRLKYL